MAQGPHCPWCAARGFWQLFAVNDAVAVLCALAVYYALRRGAALRPERAAAAAAGWWVLQGFFTALAFASGTGYPLGVGSWIHHHRH